jgi:Thiolase, N-terminal domain
MRAYTLIVKGPPDRVIKRFCHDIPAVRLFSQNRFSPRSASLAAASKDVPAPNLGAAAIVAAVARAKLRPDEVETVVMGNVVRGGLRDETKAWPNLQRCERRR